MLDLEKLKQEIADEATRAVSRGWYAEGQRIAEQIDSYERRWGVLMDALRQMGWPKGEHDE